MIKHPEAAGRILDTAAADAERTVAMANWMLQSLSLVRLILGRVLNQAEPVVADPVDIILARVPDA